MNSASMPMARAILAVAALALLATGCDRSHERASGSIAPAGASKSEARDQHAGTASHEGHAQHRPAPVLAEGQRWATDPPLRAAMTRIREAVERNAPAYDQQRLQTADAETLANAVESDITYMIANCRLDSEPDAALHALIGRMMNAAAALRKDPISEAGLPRLVAVLHEYQATFDHPGWTTPGQAH